MGEAAHTRTVNVDLTPAELWAAYDAVALRLYECEPRHVPMRFGSPELASTSVSVPTYVPSAETMALQSARNALRSVLCGERAHL